MSITVLSSKGQIVIPAKLLVAKKDKAGTKFAVYPTSVGYELIEIPKDPIKALRGLTKDLNIPSDAVKKMRQEDEKLFKRKYNL